VEFKGSAVTYSAEPGEDNNVKVKLERNPGAPFPGTDQVFVISDSVTIVDFSGFVPLRCRARGVRAECPASAGTNLQINTFDGDDRIEVDPSLTQPVFVCGGAGNDTILGGPGGDRLVGGEGSDMILGNDGADLIGGNVAPFGLLPCLDDVPDSPAGDRLEGGKGNDVLAGSAGADTMLGGPGNDSLLGFEGDDSLDGGSGNDDLAGQGGDDSLYGGDSTPQEAGGDDLIAGGVGSDSEIGGDGDDELGTNYFVDGIVSTDVGDDTMDGGPGNDLLHGESVTGVAAGGSLRQVEDAGRPEATGPNGSDVMTGADGYDTVTYEGRASPVTLSLDAAANDGDPGEQDWIGNDVEKVVGGSGDDVITGSVGSDYLDGGAGSDTVEGGEGDDVLDGGRGDEGSDHLFGGNGNDTINGRNGDDELVGGTGDDDVAGGGGTDSIRGDDGNDKLRGGPGHDDIFGGSGNDVIQGGDPLLPGADTGDNLHGGPGKDLLDGGDGGDLLAGGPGSDVLIGGRGLDVGDYSDSAGPVSITLDGQPNDGETGERDNFGADIESARGGNGKDLLSGNAGDNTLTGGAGDDFLVGAQGADRLNGNDGNDAILSRDSARDVINCGRGFDLAIVDDRDIVRDNCELVDRGGGRATALGRFVSATRLRGGVKVRPRAMDRFFPLSGGVMLPVRSSIDARKGAIRLSTRGTGGRQRSSTLRGGVFAVDQVRSRSLTVIRLHSGPLGRCAASARRALTVRTGERLRVVGREAYAWGRHATWTTTDRCDGTRIRVQRGRVRVFDRTLRKSLVLTAGEAYLGSR
jgi:Ca2+-binding RTX toxin-like protein